MRNKINKENRNSYFSLYWTLFSTLIEKLTDKYLWKSLKEDNLKAFVVLFETYYPLMCWVFFIGRNFS